MFGIPSLHAATGSNIILDNESSNPKLKLNSVIVSFIRYRRRHSRKTHPSETYPRNTCPIPTPMLPLNPRQRLPSQVKSSHNKTLLASPGVLVPHVAQDTCTFGNRLFLEARSAGSGSVIGGVTFHCGDFLEHLAGLLK
jgi:hypothetical protein